MFGHATSQKVVCEPKDVQILFLTAITTVINQILGSGSFNFNFNSDCSCISGSIALILDQPKTVFEEGKYAKKSSLTHIILFFSPTQNISEVLPFN